MAVAADTYVLMAMSSQEDTALSNDKDEDSGTSSRRNSEHVSPVLNNALEEARTAISEKQNSNWYMKPVPGKKPVSKDDKREENETASQGLRTTTLALQQRKRSSSKPQSKAQLEASGQPPPKKTVPVEPKEEEEPAAVPGTVQKVSPQMSAKEKVDAIRAERANFKMWISYSYKTWDAVTCFLAFIHALSVPAQAVLEVNGAGWWVFNAFICCIYVADIVVSATMARLTAGGELVNDKRTLFLMYAKGWFAVDLISAAFALAPGGMRLLALAKLMRSYSRWHKPWEEMEDRLSAKANLFLYIMVCFISFLFLAHWAACVWILILRSDDNAQNAEYWFPEDDFTMYLTSLHTCLLLVAGDGASVYSNSQRMFSILLIAGGTLFLAIIVGNMALAVSNVNLDATRHRKRKAAVHSAIKFLKLPEDQTKKLRAYYQYTAGRDLEGLAELKKLPRTMYTEIAQYLHCDSLHNVPLFRNCQSGFLSALAVAFEPEVFLAGQDIVKRGAMGREMYFIAKGFAEVLNPQDDATPVAVLEAGSFFGEIALLANTTRSCTVAAVSNVETFMLSANSFNMVLKLFPEEADMFHEQARVRLQGIAANDSKDEDGSCDSKDGSCIMRSCPEAPPDSDSPQPSPSQPLGDRNIDRNIPISPSNGDQQAPVQPPQQQTAETTELIREDLKSSIQAEMAELIREELKSSMEELKRSMQDEITKLMREASQSTNTKVDLILDHLNKIKLKQADAIQPRAGALQHSNQAGDVYATAPKSSDDVDELLHVLDVDAAAADEQGRWTSALE